MSVTIGNNKLSSHWKWLEANMILPLLLYPIKMISHTKIRDFIFRGLWKYPLVTFKDARLEQHLKILGQVIFHLSGSGEKSRKRGFVFNIEITLAINGNTNTKTTKEKQICVPNSLGGMNFLHNTFVAIGQVQKKIPPYLRKNGQ